jgi:hypothetical protein
MDRGVPAFRGSGRDHDPGHAQKGGNIATTRSRRPRWWLHPVAVSVVLTIAFLPLSTTAPTFGLDGSWQVGLSLVHLRGIAAGPGFLFTYGPLGFLAYPNIVWLPGAILGLAYVVTTTFAFYYLVCRRLLDWLPSIIAAVLTAVFALVTAQLFSVSEVATAVIILWALSLVRPGSLNMALSVWVAPALGAAAALQLLVKFGTGGIALAAAVVVSVARPPRLKNAASSAAAFVASFLVLWLAAQQSLADIAQWLRGSLQIAAGYSSAMATLAGFAGGRYWRFWLVAVGVLCFGFCRLVATHRARALPTIALVTLAAWYFTKEGLTRLDQSHANVAYVCLGALIAAVPWERRWMPLGLVGLAVTLAAVVATAGSVGSYPSRVRQLVLQPSRPLGEAERIVRSTIDPSFRSRELLAARASIGAKYGLPNDLMRGFRNARVDADPWSIAVVWADELRWTPVPVFQTYSAYTPSLDQLNADSLQSSKGPNVVIRLRHPYSLPWRVDAWESPNYMVALTCGYEVTAVTPRWQVLQRASDACGQPRLTGQTILHSGETVVVPAARNANDIVVAAFDYPHSTFEQLATLLLKPSSLPSVVMNAAALAFVAGTASQLHLVHVPKAIGTRHITNAGFDIRSLSFPNAPGVVTVRFYELSIG